MLLVSLMEPSFGLIFWMTLSFAIAFFVLAKYAWKPILQALHDREQSIEDAIDQAKKAREEVAAMKAGNEELLQQARMERDQLLREAREIRAKEIADAKERAKAEADAMLARARAEIRNEKNAALTEMKNQMGALSIEVAERILREKLGDQAAQDALLEKVLKESDLHLS